MADAVAMKAVNAGTADADQQKRAIVWIVQHACITAQMAYQPDSARDTDFALGRVFAGQQIVKLINLSPDMMAKLRSVTDERDSNGEH